MVLADPVRRAHEQENPIVSGVVGSIKALYVFIVAYLTSTQGDGVQILNSAHVLLDRQLVHETYMKEAVDHRNVKGILV